MASKEPNQKEGYVFGRSRNATSRSAYTLSLSPKLTYEILMTLSSCCSLNYQHYLWQNAFGFHLHPSIPQLATDVRIADLATGSG